MGGIDMEVLWLECCFLCDLFVETQAGGLQRAHRVDRAGWRALGLRLREVRRVGRVSSDRVRCART